MKKVVILPGRFQPMLRHHVEVYNHLQAQFPDSEVYIATTDKVDGEKSPFNFEEKKQIIESLGIPSDKVLQVTRPYHKDDYTPFFDESDTVIVFALGEKDVDRFPFDNISPKTGLDMGHQGANVPKYFQKINTYNNDQRPMSERGYITMSPTIESDSDEAASASAFRAALAASPDVEAAKEIVEKQYGQYNEKIFNLLYQKIKGTTEMKESKDADILEGLMATFEQEMVEDSEIDEDNAHGDECKACEGEGCEACDYTGYDELPSWDAKKERGLGEGAEDNMMNEDIARMKHLAGLTEAPIEFDAAAKPKKNRHNLSPEAKARAKARREKDDVDKISPKDQRAAAERPANALASNPDAATFLPPSKSDIDKSIANFFPAGVDINDPAVKKENFIKAIQKAPAILFGEINARLGTDDNSLAVSDRISDIVRKFEEGGNLSTLSQDEKTFAMKLALNAMDTMELQRKSGDEVAPADDIEVDDEYDDDMGAGPDIDSVDDYDDNDAEFEEDAVEGDEECSQCHGCGVMASGEDYDGTAIDFECKKCNGTGYADGRHREPSSDDYYGDDRVEEADRESMMVDFDDSPEAGKKRAKSMTTSKEVACPGCDGDGCKKCGGTGKINEAATCKGCGKANCSCPEGECNCPKAVSEEEEVDEEVVEETYEESFNAMKIRAGI